MTQDTLRNFIGSAGRLRRHIWAFFEALAFNFKMIAFSTTIRYTRYFQ